MDSDSKFYLGVLALIVAGIVAVTALLIFKGIHTRNTMTDMVRAGANPIDAACALDYSTSVRDASCVLAKRGPSP